MIKQQVFIRDKFGEIVYEGLADCNNHERDQLSGNKIADCHIDDYPPILVWKEGNEWLGWTK